jgi:hypothetical protein
MIGCNQADSEKADRESEIPESPENGSAHEPNKAPKPTCSRTIGLELLKRVKDLAFLRQNSFIGNPRQLWFLRE